MIVVLADVWYARGMKPRETFPEELEVSYDRDKGLAFYGMKTIVVDEIFGSWINKIGDFGVYKNVMIDLKDDVDPASTPRSPFFSGPYEYEHDGYPIDEEVFLRRGWVISTNPIHDWERNEALKEPPL